MEEYCINYKYNKLKTKDNNRMKRIYKFNFSFVFILTIIEYNLYNLSIVLSRMVDMVLDY